MALVCLTAIGALRQACDGARDNPRLALRSLDICFSPSHPAGRPFTGWQFGFHYRSLARLRHVRLLISLTPDAKASAPRGRVALHLSVQLE